MKKYRIQFEGGESRHDDYAVNYLICMDAPEGVTLYAECPSPCHQDEYGEWVQDCSEFYGYHALKADILAQAAEAGIPVDQLEFWCDGHEDELPVDAAADVDVKRW